MKVALLTMSLKEQQLIIQEYLKYPSLKIWLEEQSKKQEHSKGMILPEDELLISALSQQGIEANLVVWNDQDTDWKLFDLCICRSIWFWHHEPDEFFHSCENISKQIPLWNSLPLMKWSANKSYLIELEKSGVPTVATLHFQKGSKVKLSEICQEKKWSASVVKPAVSQGARNITRISQIPRPGFATLEEGQATIDSLLMKKDIVIQPYIESIESNGEISAVYINGKTTHAVQRFPNSGDFLAIGYPLTSEKKIELDQGINDLVNKALSVIKFPLQFARFDMVMGNDHLLNISEIEIIAPRLFLQYSKEALDCLVQAIKNEINAADSLEIR